MSKRAPSGRTFAGRSPDFQRDMLHYLTTVVYSENRPKAGMNNQRILLMRYSSEYLFQ